MKRIIAILLTALLCILLASCAPFLDAIGQDRVLIPPTPELTPDPVGGTSLFEFIGDPDVLAFAENFETDFPVSVTVEYTTVAGGEPVTVTDEQTIRAVFEALSGMTVLGEAGSGHTDDYLNYYFELADGTFIGGFEFQSGMYLDGYMALYQVSGFDELEKALAWYDAPAGAESTYTNDVLGFGLVLPPGWTASDIVDNGDGVHTVQFTPGEPEFVEANLFLGVTHSQGASREDIIQGMDVFLESFLETMGGVEVAVVQEGYTQLAYVDAYGIECETTMQDGSVVTTYIYLVDGGNTSCYNLFYPLRNDYERYWDFVDIAEGILDTFTLTGRSREAQDTPAPSQAPVPTPQPSGQTGGAKVDYMQFTGISTPEDIAAMYGTPSDVEESAAEGMPYLMYHYRNASISFTPVDGVWLVDGVMNYRPDSPITVGGVSVGMDSYTAEETLLDHGYSYETTDSEGYMYYSFYDERAMLCLVALLVDENLVSEANGWYGPVAESILATDGGA